MGVCSRLAPADSMNSSVPVLSYHQALDESWRLICAQGAGNGNAQPLAQKLRGGSAAGLGGDGQARRRSV